MNKPVSFPIAKLLKEKGFEDGYYAQYWERNDGKQFLIDTFEEEYRSLNHEDSNVEDMLLLCGAPTIAEVVMWLYEKHKIWISVEPINKFWKFILFSKQVDKVENLTRAFHTSPSEAYEAAIEYTLKKVN